MVDARSKKDPDLERRISEFYALSSKVFNEKIWLSDLSLEDRAKLSTGFTISAQYRDGSIIVLRRLLFEAASIEISRPFDITYFTDVYHYNSVDWALSCLLSWVIPDESDPHKALRLVDPEEKEPWGWVRHAPSYRRRAYDEVGNLVREWTAK